MIAHIPMPVIHHHGAEQKPAAPVVAAADALTLEESFLKVSKMCKDRTFAFDPTPVGREKIAAAVMSLHLAMDGVNA